MFVGGLPYHTSDESLREFFNSFGEIEEAVVIHDRATGKSKGYGFVSCSFLLVLFVEYLVDYVTFFDSLRIRFMTSND